MSRRPTVKPRTLQDVPKKEEPAYARRGRELAARLQGEGRTDDADLVRLLADEATRAVYLHYDVATAANTLNLLLPRSRIAFLGGSPPVRDFADEVAKMMQAIRDAARWP